MTEESVKSAVEEHQEETEGTKTRIFVATPTQNMIFWAIVGFAITWFGFNYHQFDIRPPSVPGMRDVPLSYLVIALGGGIVGGLIRVIRNVAIGAVTAAESRSGILPLYSGILSLAIFAAYYFAPAETVLIPSIAAGMFHERAWQGLGVMLK